MVGVQEESLGWKQGLEWIGMMDLVFKLKSLIEFGSSIGGGGCYNRIRRALGWF